MAEPKKIDAKIHIKVGDIHLKLNAEDAKSVYEQLSKIFREPSAELSPQPNSSIRHGSLEYRPVVNIPYTPYNEYSGTSRIDYFNNWVYNIS